MSLEQIMERHKHPCPSQPHCDTSCKAWWEHPKLVCYWSFRQRKWRREWKRSAGLENGNDRGERNVELRTNGVGVGEEHRAGRRKQEGKWQ